MSFNSFRQYSPYLSWWSICICSPQFFSFHGVDLGNDKSLALLIWSFSLERPKGSLAPSAWDLIKVLCCLRSDYFEPLEAKPLKVVTDNVLFLIALATVKRVEVLQALSKKVSYQGRDLVVSYLSWFVAKTDSVRNPFPRFYVFKSLEDFAAGLPKDRLLCPVRALSIYLNLTCDLIGRALSVCVSL